MSIKKDIEKILKVGGTVKLNDISYLTRWTEDALGNPCDGLSLTFKYFCGIKGGSICDIEARDYQNIIDEVGEKTTDYFARCASKALKNLKNGYR